MSISAMHLILGNLLWLITVAKLGVSMASSRNQSGKNRAAPEVTSTSSTFLHL